MTVWPKGDLTLRLGRVISYYKVDWEPEREGEGGDLFNCCTMGAKYARGKGREGNVGDRPMPGLFTDVNLHSKASIHCNMDGKQQNQACKVTEKKYS